MKDKERTSKMMDENAMLFGHEKILTFASDVDGVIFDTVFLQAEIMTMHYGYTVTPEDIIYNFSQIPNAKEFVRKHCHLWENHASPVKGAIEALNFLDKFCKGYYISSREASARGACIQKFYEHGICQCSDHIILTSGGSKVEACRENDVDVMIEDSIRNANEIAEELEIPVLLLKTDYNCGKRYRLVYDCENWLQIVEEILKIAKMKGQTI